ncbi:MAG: D-alanyl-D-alanine endopeptidase [Paracidovorax wautersii]|uniref:D-alanyl-D-alanine endopeptidase n=1 Tax=Paracidovorax wautersii TaxID=1177982 RepID=A0A7V8FS31_9BURK|nr:MAG: D-alanyl-D-alanine endopeptidase [Paracidovorax wautersii]
MLRRDRLSFLTRSMTAMGLAVGLVFGLAQPAQASTATKKPVAAAKKDGAAAKPAAKATAKSSKTAKSTKAAAAAKSPAVRKASAKAGARSGVRVARKSPPSKGSIAKKVVAAAVVAPAAASLSLGQAAGLHTTRDPLALKASVALVVDQDTQEVLFSKNERAVLPIASITKLMTGLLISEAGLDLTEELTITQDDVDVLKHSSSRLAVGTRLTRGEMLQLALMSSENRAAHALARTHPEGLRRFVAMMNARAMMLGMRDTHYVEPTGLSSENQSSARDLAILVNAAYRDPMVSAMSVTPGHEVSVGSRTLQYNNSNRLVRNGDWDIGLQKTGYISEAGHCLVMQSRVAGRKVIMVFLDSGPGQSRLADAQRVRHWLEASNDRHDARMQSARAGLNDS